MLFFKSRTFLLSGRGVERDGERGVYALGVSVPGDEASQHRAQLSQPLLELFGHTQKPRVCEDGS